MKDKYLFFFFKVHYEEYLTLGKVIGNGTQQLVLFCFFAHISEN